MITLSRLAEFVGGVLAGDGDLRIEGAAPLESATATELAFVDAVERRGEAVASTAGALIVPQGLELEGRNRITVPLPKLAFARALACLYPDSVPFDGVADSAFISSTAELGDGVAVGPGAVIEAGAHVGSRSVIYPGVYVGRRVVLGAACRLYPNVVVMDGCRLGDRVIVHAGAVIGSDGFGYVTDAGVHHKIPQVGDVVIEDDVELGANVTVDRATLGSTVVGAGSKIDNLTQVAHNVRVGTGCLFAAQTGIAGSSEVGDDVVMGGQVGLADHIRVGHRVMVAAQSGLARDVPDGQIIAGTPAVPHRQWLRATMLVQRLPEMERRLRALEKALEKP